jgi:hypothetical protein
MSTNGPAMDDWKKLYDLMAQVKNLAPWEWMEEDDIFGFQMPGTDELGFISVMGTLGEHFSIAIYQGVRGLDGFWHMQELGEKITPETLLQVPQLQASFEDRAETTPEDREIIKQLGLKFRGAKAWPQFRSFRPGCFPWYIEKAEAEMLICGLEQLLDVAPRFKQNFDIFMPTDNDDDYLVRVQKKNTWEDTVFHVESHASPMLNLKMNMAALAYLKQMMPGKAIVEVDLFMVSNPVQEDRKERPYFPYMLMVCDHESRMILSTDLLKPLPTLEAMWETIPAKTVEVLAKSRGPKELMVRTDFLKSLLGFAGEELGCKVKKSARLAAIDSARKELDRFF